MSAAKNAQFESPAHVVIGDGWAALAAVGFLVQKLREENSVEGAPRRGVIWIAGTGARMLSALPSMETGPGVELWQRLAHAYGGETGEPATGSFLREFRNKAFREPAWTKAPTPEARQEVMNESLWAPERRLAPLWESRFPLSLNEIEQKLRTLLLGDGEEGAPWRELIRRFDGMPVTGFKVENDQVKGVILGSGEEIACESVLYADLWASLPTIQGLPKNLPFIRGREPASVLQATFTHAQPIGVGLMEGFFGSLHKESGEEFERRVWGHFSSDGMQSYWTLCLTGDEVEDNHQIAKKLRRMKNALDKMFTGSSWLPEAKPEFMNNIASEAVRFQESVVFTEGAAPAEPVTLKHVHGLQFVTDGYGPSSSLAQVARALGLPEAQMPSVNVHDLGVTGAPEGTDAQAEDMNREGPTAS